LGAQLNMVARLIAARDHLSMKRQTFFVSMSGFDLHSGMATNHAPLLQELGDAMGAFQTAMNNAGLADSVLGFTASDFGRALTINGDGTDHGWGGHHFVLGGAVKGGEIYGRFPIFGLNNNQDSANNAYLPVTSVDTIGSTLGRWFGVSDANLDTVFPNLKNFSRDLGFLKPA
jgi:uncharacterized protein (DUF1501 family)